ncbi:FAD:protein FMN transferase ApbE [Nissabacter sp. SGAir0207]|uniref:FAD:protein FMN transferase ApbE n=1 Tax=Nissabacter sp. SGAir0207 TaxID=2126321 RepID=UPI0010CD05A5|nr:FAD:protein FMN transferase ApbE [Nissabacter sp. SGAir0207]
MPHAFLIRAPRLTLPLLAALLLAGCQRDDPPAEAMVIEGHIFGTTYRVNVAGVEAAQRPALEQAVRQVLERDDREISTYKPDSLISRFNRYPGTDPQPISADMADVITTALRIGTLTRGKMDITVGPLVNLWGFGPDKQPVKTPTDQQIAQARQRVGLRHLTVSARADGQWLQKDLPGLYVDLSTVGEGYATDHLARLMEQRGIGNYLVSVGGAVLTRGVNASGQPWRVAIQKPTDRENAVQAIVNLQGHGISTSGSYRNYYELDGKRISHIIDPDTGRPITHKLVSATVIAPTATLADTWDTGLMLLGTEQALAVAKQQGLAVYLVTREGDRFTSYMSPQFRAFLLDEEK